MEICSVQCVRHGFNVITFTSIMHPSACLSTCMYGNIEGVLKCEVTRFHTQYCIMHQLILSWNRIS